MVVVEVNKDNFEEEVIKSNKAVIIDFWAEWCAPCRIFSPIIEEVSKEYDGKIKFFKLNTDENPEIAARYNVMSIPTAMLFEKGNAVAMSVGAVPKETLKRWIEKNISKI